MRLPYWLTREWWKFILAPRGDEVSWLKAALCRWRGHPYGVVWYNTTGDEPDMTCKNCGDDLNG